MGVPFKKIARKDPRKADAVAKFYPQLVTLGDNATLDDIAYVMKEKSSLTLGDIQSVLTNFVAAMSGLTVLEGRKLIFTALMFLAVHSFTSNTPAVRADRLNTPKFLIFTDWPL